MIENVIKIRGARVHNLQNINVDIPKNKLVVITGISGSGKSSLAFDTLYAEGQRRYIESLSAYARQFLGVMQKPDADTIEGISPAISIDQRKAGHNPRSTAGTITEIYDYLRLLFARIGIPHCPKCKKVVSRQTIDQIVEQIFPARRDPAGRERLPKNSEITILGPIIRGEKGEHQGILEEIQRAGFVRVRIDGIIYPVRDFIRNEKTSRKQISNGVYRVDEILSHLPPRLALRGSATEEVFERLLDRKKKHNIEVVVDRLIIEKDLDWARLADSLKTALKLGKGTVIIAKNEKRKTKNENDLLFSEHFACEKCGISLPELEPRLFSFNSPYGACPACQGLGERLEVNPKLVIPNPNLSIAEGAIFPWAYTSHTRAIARGGDEGKLRRRQTSSTTRAQRRVESKKIPSSPPSLSLHESSVMNECSSTKVGRQSFFGRQLEELAERKNIDLYAPIKNLSEEKINLILYGNENFEGVIPWLEKRYYEASSEYTREEIEKYMVERKCEKCQGKRLKPEVLAVKVAEKSIDEIVTMSIAKAKEFFEAIAKPTRNSPPTKFGGGQAQNRRKTLSENEFRIAQPINKEILNRLQFLIDVGLNYLTIDRKAATLAGGEEQRIRLATQIGSKLSGVLYILDEPSVGLHARDQGRLIATLKKLRDLGNTILVVEHDPQTIKAADWAIDIGPGAGKHGGRVIFQGTPKELLKAKTLTGEYLSGRKKVEITRPPKSKIPRPTSPSAQSKAGGQIKDQKINYLIIKKAAEHNLKNIDVKIPLGKFVCITGVSGSGKSSLMNDILARALMKKFYKAKEEPGKYEEVLGVEYLNKVVLVDQSPIGRTPRSNPATYTGCFSYIRDLFSRTKEARIHGYQPGRFSFNVRGGRCETCEGQGQIKIEMYFLPDIYQECQECKGKGFNKETLSIEYKGKNIAQVLEMTIEEALEFFKDTPGLYQKLKTLNDVGLGYIQLGQPAPSLSGGEAQRVKLATELGKKATGKTLYILDEPTTGLHPDDIKKLVWVLRGLVDKGNTVLCVEHNLDILRNADYLIDLGPEGGEEGGYIIAEGTPYEITKNRKSYTGKYLKEFLFNKCS